MKLLCIKEMTSKIKNELLLLKQDWEKQTGRICVWNPEEIDPETEIRCYLIYDDHLLISALIVTLFCESDSLFFDFFAMTRPEYQRQGYFTDLYDQMLDDFQDEYGDRPWISELFIQKEQVPDGFLEAFDYQKGPSEYLMEKKYLLDQDPLDAAVCLTPANDFSLLASHYGSIFGMTQEQAQIAMEELSRLETWYLIQKKQKTIGIVLLMKEQTGTYLCNFGILPEYRKQHLGTAALSIIEKQEKQTITLQVSGGNQAAISLYMKNGYQITKEYVSYHQEF